MFLIKSSVSVCVHVHKIFFYTVGGRAGRFLDLND